MGITSRQTWWCSQRNEEGREEKCHINIPIPTVAIWMRNRRWHMSLVIFFPNHFHELDCNIRLIQILCLFIEGKLHTLGSPMAIESSLQRLVLLLKDAPYQHLKEEVSGFHCGSSKSSSFSANRTLKLFCYEEIVRSITSGWCDQEHSWQADSSTNRPPILKGEDGRQDGVQIEM